MTHLLPLNQLRAGETARIAQLVGRPEEVHRLEELGLRQGEVVEMLQGGTPCIIRLAGAKLCFRHGEALHVLVEVEG